MPEGRDAAIIRAAGAVVWRPGSLGPEVALVHRPRYDDWSYPKGKCERDEHVLRTAIREVAEETGLRVILGRPLTSSVYPSGSGTKRVSFWVARCVESTGFVPGAEVDQVAWLPVTAARDLLSYQRDVALTDEFRSGPASSVPFILLRHATAGRRQAAGSSDLARPLDAQGAADAELLARLLSCYGPCRVVSSPAERCMATVRPYAAAVGVPVQVEPAFLVPADIAAPGVLTPAAAARAAVGTAAAAAPPQAARRAALRAAELAGRGMPTLICAHRENLQVMLDAACHALRASPPAGAPLPRASFWVLQSAGGALVSAEQQQLAE